MPSLKVIDLTLEPYMALKKKLVATEKGLAERKNAAFGIAYELSDFWGLKGWFETQALRQGRAVEVRCPNLEQMFPKGN